MGNSRNSERLYVLGGSKINADGDCSHEIKRCLLLGRKAMANLDSILKSRDITLPKGPSSQGSGFSSSHVWMWELDYKESWTLKNWCVWTLVLEKTLESPLDCKESSQSVKQLRTLVWWWGEMVLQHHSSKALVLQHSAFFIAQLSHPYMTTGKTIALTRWTFVAK